MFVCLSINWSVSQSAYQPISPPMSIGQYVSLSPSVHLVCPCVSLSVLSISRSESVCQSYQLPSVGLSVCLREIFVRLPLPSVRGEAFFSNQDIDSFFVAPFGTMFVLRTENEEKKDMKVFIFQRTTTTITTTTKGFPHSYHNLIQFFYFVVGWK